VQINIVLNFNMLKEILKIFKFTGNIIFCFTTYPSMTIKRCFSES